MEKLNKLLEKIKESEFFQELKAKYEELDTQTKFYVNLAVLGCVSLFILSTVLWGIGKVNGMKSDIEDREELIGYLQRSADTIKRLKAQNQTVRGPDINSTLPIFMDNVLEASNLDRSKVEVGAETQGADEKDSTEMLLELKVNQVNLRQLTQLLFTITDLGEARNLNIKNLLVDTKGDPSGYLDAVVTLSNFKAK